MAFFFNGNNVQWINVRLRLGLGINHNDYPRRDRDKIRMRHRHTRAIAQLEHKRFCVSVQSFPNQI